MKLSIKIVMILIGSGGLSQLWAVEPVKKVFISQFSTHSALDKTTQGIIDGLQSQGYESGINLDLRIESAQGNTVLSSQISAKFVNQGADVVVGMSTLSAQRFVKYAQENKTHLVFSSVTDPLQAGLVTSLEQPGNNTSGVSNFVDIQPQLRLFQQIQPSLKRLGFLYNPAEANSQALLLRLQSLSAEFGLLIVPQSVHRTADIAQTVTKLVTSVDAIFISNDSTALSALQLIIDISNKSNVPVYVSDIDAVDMGAIAALGPNQYELGKQTAILIARSLNGENLGSIPVEFPKKTEIYLNKNAANILGISFSEDLLSQASAVIIEGEEL